MTTTFEPPGRTLTGRPLTVATLWEGLTGAPLTEVVLDWPPDVAVFTSVLVERAQLFRFVLSPPDGATWPPPSTDPWPSVVAEAVAAWVTSVGDGSAELPDRVVEAWRCVLHHADTPVTELVAGRPWALCEALLTLHAIADEACAGCTSRRSDACGLGGVVFLGRSRELLARTGSMARLSTDRVRVLPRVRTATCGITHRSLSRYSAVRTDGMRVVWHKASVRRSGDEAFRHANLLLLPWPLVVHERDFHSGPVRRPEREPFGLFEFAPEAALDLDLVDRLLDAALAEVDHVDVVVLPECAVAEHELSGLEEVLARHRTPLLIAGTRTPPIGRESFGGNVVHIGALVAGQWWQYRQVKHHRWYLEANQIGQYHLGGALHPAVRWWEAMAVPERSMQFIELGDGITIATVICEDLARLDGVAELLRSVGPTLVFVLLLDGPQISPRWTSRYATVLADDPGSAVLTLTAHGMVRRSQPPGHPPSHAVALWKDAASGPREINLEPGAQGVLITTALDRATRYAPDGRPPADDGTELVLAGVHPVHAGAAPPTPGRTHRLTDGTGLDTGALSLLAGWAETLAEATTFGRDAVTAVVADLAPTAAWRDEVGIEPLDEHTARALQVLGALARVTVDRVGSGVCESVVLTELEGRADDGDDTDRLARRLLRNALGAVCARRHPSDVLPPAAAVLDVD